MKRVVVLLISVTLSFAEFNNASLPHWQNLECVVGTRVNIILIKKVLKMSERAQVSILRRYQVLAGCQGGV